MARLFTSGFELNTLTDGVEIFRGATQSGAIVTSPVHSQGVGISGTYSYQNKPSSSIQNCVIQFGPSGNKTIYYRWYYNITTQPANNALVVGFETTSGSTLACRLRGTTSGLRFTDSGDTQRGSDFALSTGQWYRIEAKIFSNSSTGTADIWVDGVNVVSVTGINTNGGDLQFLQFGSGVSLTHEYYIDDIAINDTSGSFQNSYPGPGIVVAGHPNANGTTTTGWTRGGTDSGADWSQVNEVTPNDATNYISAAGGGGPIDLFTTAALPFSGNDTLNVYHVGVRYNNDIGDASVNFLVEVYDRTASVAQSGSLIAGSTTWRTNGTSLVAYNAYPLTIYPTQAAGVEPLTAVANSWQIGCGSVAGGTHKIQVSTIWTMIDFWPAVRNSIFVKQAINRAATY